MTAPLIDELKHYETIREDLAIEHAGKYVAIKGREILGVYRDYMAAARDLYTEHEQGSVFIQEVKPGKDAHMGIIHTPGILALK